MRTRRSAAPRTGRRARRGFTLLEAAVALTIVALAAVTGLAAFGAQLRAAARARWAVAAAALAEDRLAAVRLLPPESFPDLPDSLRRGRFSAPFEGVAWTADARRVPDDRWLFDVGVTVSGEDGRFDLHTRVYRPPAARPGGVSP